MATIAQMKDRTMDREAYQNAMRAIRATYSMGLYDWITSLPEGHEDFAYHWYSVGQHNNYFSWVNRSLEYYRERFNNPYYNPITQSNMLSAAWTHFDLDRVAIRPALMLA